MREAPCLKFMGFCIFPRAAGSRSRQEVDMMPPPGAGAPCPVPPSDPLSPLSEVTWASSLCFLTWAAGLRDRCPPPSAPGRRHLGSGQESGAVTVEFPRVKTQMRPQPPALIWPCLTRVHASRAKGVSPVHVGPSWVGGELQACLEGIMLSEASQSEKDNHHVVSLIRGI